MPADCLLVLWGLFVLFQVDRPDEVGLTYIEEYHGEAEALLVPGETPAAEIEGPWRVVAEVLRNRMVWLLAGVYFLIKPTRYLILSWSPVYINERLGTGTATSGVLGSMFDLAGPVGTLACGYLSDRVFKSKRMPMAIIALLCLAVLMAA